MHRRQTARESQLRDFLTAPEHQVVGKEYERLGAGILGLVEGSYEVFCALKVSREKLDPARFCRLAGGNLR